MQNMKFAYSIFMNIDENQSALSEINEQNKNVLSALHNVNVPILHLSNTINIIQSQLYAKPLWLCKISNMHIHEY